MTDLIGRGIAHVERRPWQDAYMEGVNAKDKIFVQAGLRREWPCLQ